MFDNLQGQLGLGLERSPVQWNLGLVTALFAIRPGLGKVKPRIYQGGIFSIAETALDRNLGIGCFADITTVLMARPNAFVSFFHPTAFINEQPGKLLLGAGLWKHPQPPCPLPRGRPILNQL